MIQSLTELTEVSPKVIWQLQPHRSQRWAQREAQGIRDAQGSRVVLACHLALAWSVPIDALLMRLAALY